MSMSHIEKIVKTIVKNQYVEFLRTKKKISYLSAVAFLKHKLHLDIYFEKGIKSLVHKSRRIFYLKHKRIKENETIKELKRKYDLNIEDAYCYLHLMDKFKLNKSDLEKFETFLEILTNDKNSKQ